MHAGITMEAIAKEAGVSRQTASLIFNNRWKEKRISQETRHRVLAVAEQHHYLPSVTGRNLVTQKTRSIGIAIYSFECLTDLYFSTIIGGIAHHVGAHDYNLHFTITDTKAKAPRSNLVFTKKVKERSFDGLIVIDQQVADEEILWLKETGVPFVLIDRCISGRRVHSVRINNRQGIFRATEHLIKLGHRRIAFVTEPRAWNKITDMVTGYRMALAKHGLGFDEDLLVEYIGGGQTLGVRIVEEIFGSPKPPTGIVTSCDMHAVWLLMGMKGKGIKVPEDVALVGYNDDPGFLCVEPLLTTIRVPLRELGDKSGEMLFKLIAGVGVKDSEIVLEPKLVIRESCGSVRKNDGSGVSDEMS